MTTERKKMTSLKWFHYVPNNDNAVVIGHEVAIQAHCPEEADEISQCVIDIDNKQYFPAICPESADFNPSKLGIYPVYFERMVSYDPDYYGD